MPKPVFGAAAEGLPKINRRTFLRRAGSAGAVASLAALPSVAATLAAPATSNEQQLEACLADLKEILGRMHPVVTDISHGYYAREDGTFRLWINCTREFLEYSGPGFYRVSDDGYIMTWWLEKVEERTLSGKVYGHVFLADMYLEDEGRFVGEVRRMWEPKIVEKLEGDREMHHERAS